MRRILLLLLLFVLMGCNKVSEIEKYYLLDDMDKIEINRMKLPVLTSDKYIKKIDFNDNGIEFFYNDKDVKILYDAYIDRQGEITRQDEIDIGFHDNIEWFEILYHNDEYIVWFQKYNEGYNYTTKVYMTSILNPTKENTTEIYSYNVVHYEEPKQVCCNYDYYYHIFARENVAFISGDYVSFTGPKENPWIIYNYKLGEFIDTASDIYQYPIVDKFTGDDEKIITEYYKYSKTEFSEYGYPVLEEIGISVFDTTEENFKHHKLPIGGIYHWSLKMNGNKVITKSVNQNEEYEYVHDVGIYNLDNNKYHSVIKHSSFPKKSLVSDDYIILYDYNDEYKEIIKIVDINTSKSITINNGYRRYGMPYVLHDYLITSTDNSVYFYYIGDLFQ